MLGMNMIAKIGNSLIKQLIPSEKVYDVRDINLKGFLIRVHPSGSMSYICQFKRGRRINLGKVGDITAAQAREKAIEILSNMNKGIEPTVQKGINKPKNLQEFIETEYKPWVLSQHKRGNKTLATLTRCFNKLFLKPLSEISPSMLDQWRLKRLNEGISNATLNRDIGVLKSLLTKAAEWGFLQENPLKNLKLLKIDRSPKVRYLSLDPEFEEENACDYLMPMVLLSINTGLRQGELFNLSWGMVNLEERSLILCGGITKNSTSRYIPLNDEANQIIQHLYKKSDRKVGLVFPNKNNQPYNNVKRSWTSVLKKANIDQFRWHDLRHHFASKLVMVGIDLNTVRELLGHSDIKMTLRYAHLAPEHKINAVKKIDWSPLET